ncbi:hypothetical protein PGB90_005104 [Kerria lacca]
MKEHRTKALRVTTPHSIESSNASNKDEFISRENANDLFGTLQILQFEFVPSIGHTRFTENATTSDKSYSQISSTRYSQSETMTMHTATITANPVFGKHDSFYRWFSAVENNNEQQISQGNCDDRECCDKCNNNQDEQASKTCHCRSAFQKKKLRHKKSVSADGIQLFTPLFPSDYSCSILDIVSGDLCENWFLKIRDIKEVINRDKTLHQRNDWCKSKDTNGNTALLVSGQKLLKEGQFDKAVELVKIFLEEGADVNVINNENRTLLSYSIPYMDKSIHLTTLLLNYGANVWPIPPNPELPLRNNSRIYEKYGSSSNCNSAFTWFLRGVIKQLRLSDHCLQTLYVLAEIMGENPNSMHSHVMSTMFSHARCYSILGPVFLQIKLAMSPYWSQPQSLKFLCRSIIRKSIINVPGRFINNENISSLMLPPSLQSYLMLES